MVDASMVDPVEKSTEAVQEVVWKSEEETVILDSRLAIYAEAGRWLAVSDLHFGYEIRRRARGGLWPMWGRETIKSRIGELLDEYEPELLIFNGDIVDGASSACSEVIPWLDSLRERCENLVLIEGNHDRGELIRSLKFVSRFEIGDFVFHHGHMPVKPVKPGQIEVVGHVHPSIRFNDRAGLSMKLPGLIQEHRRWILPAFSPWAGGVDYQGETGAISWACSPGRIFQSAG